MKILQKLQVPYVVKDMEKKDVTPMLVWTSTVLMIFATLFSIAGWLAVPLGESVNGDIICVLPLDGVVCLFCHNK